MRRALLFLVAAGALPLQLRAQGAPAYAPRPLDRVVAVVGSKAILWSEVLEVIQQRRAQGLQIPEDSAGQIQLARQVLNELVDEEVLVQKAEQDTSITVADADLRETVEAQLRQTRGNFRNDQEFFTALRNAGFGTQEEYRRWLMDQARRRELQQRLVQKYQREGRMLAVAVSDEEVTEAFERNRDRLPRRPPAVTFRQIVIATQASPEAKAAARAKAESLLAEIRRGGDFEQLARRESMDTETKEQGGDLGWNRRDQMVPEFDRMMFALAPGQVSPVVETIYGFHIIKVDRVRPSEVKARHILIKPRFDSSDVVRARALADSVLELWKRGTPFDTLVKRFHDRTELEGSFEPFERQRLPESYARAFEGKGAGDFAGPFAIEDRQRGVPKFVIAQITGVVEEGEYSIQDLRERIRESLSQEKAFRRLLDQLKKETYVRILPFPGERG